MELKEFVKTVDPYFKYWAVLIICPLIFGFVIVNIYLGTYGFFDFSFFRVKYVSTGILFMICLVIFYIFSSITFTRLNIANSNITDSKIRKNIRILTYIVFTAFLYALFLSLIISSTSTGGSIDFNKLLYLFPSEFVFTAVVLYLFWKIFFELPNKSSNNNFPSIILSFLGLMLLTTSLYALLIYPYISNNLGGGKSVKATFYFKDENRLLKITGMTQELDVSIIYQSSEYILFEKDNNVFLIKYDELLGIKYSESVKDLKKLYP